MSALWNKSGFRFVFPETPKIKSTDKDIHKVYENLVKLRTLNTKLEKLERKFSLLRRKKA